MRLSDLYKSLGSRERVDLAHRALIAPGYLYQLATRWRGRKPTVDVMSRLLKADARLLACDLVQEFGDSDASELAERERADV